MYEWQCPKQTKRQSVTGSIVLKLTRGEDFQIVEFLETELRDVEATPELQARLEGRMREGL